MANDRKRKEPSNPGYEIFIGIFGTFTGHLANLFLAPNKKPSSAEPHSPSDEARAKVNQLKQLMAEQQASIDEIEELLQADR